MSSREEAKEVEAPGDMNVAIERRWMTRFLCPNSRLRLKDVKLLCKYYDTGTVFEKRAISLPKCAYLREKSPDLCQEIVWGDAWKPESDAEYLLHAERDRCVV
jgi:hypothetical protein